MQHVFVETNWIVAYAAPVHHQVPAARSLLDRAQAGQLRLYLPAVCLNEARRTIQNKHQPRNEAKAIRTFLIWGKENGRISAEEDALVRRVVDMFQAKIAIGLAGRF